MTQPDENRCEVLTRLMVQVLGRQRLRVAFGVADAKAATAHLFEAEATLVAAPTPTPERSLNSLPEGSADLQLTLFQELNS